MRDDGIGYVDGRTDTFLGIPPRRTLNASRLSDNVSRKQTTWDPEPVRLPLILMEERKLDPTPRSYPLEHNRPEEDAFGMLVVTRRRGPHVDQENGFRLMDCEAR
jgi:hypothetical protein